jgi:signal transduction histidine kinase
MNKRHSLQDRIAASFVLLALVVCSFFTLTAYISIEIAEAQLRDDRLIKLSETLIREYRENQMPNVPPEIKFYADDAVPPQWKNLGPGNHEIMVGGHEVHVLVFADNGHRFVVTYEENDFEQTELVIYIALAAGFITSLLLAIMLGLATARRVIAPVSALAEAVENNVPPESLPSLNAQDEIGLLSRAFARRTDELQRFLMRERLFTGDVSHELRTPLTIMLGAAELLKVQLTDSPERQAVAERLRRVAAETSERVSALLLLSRAPETIDAPLIPLDSLIENKPVRCDVDFKGRGWVHARPELAGIAIGNILRNACMYTESGTVTVRLTSDSLSIEDNGPGIPENLRARLFERFIHVDNGQPGEGLGLSIVKRVTEHLQWNLQLEDASGGGSRFLFTFPPVAPPP